MYKSKKETIKISQKFKLNQINKRSLIKKINSKERFKDQSSNQ